MERHYVVLLVLILSLQMMALSISGFNSGISSDELRILVPSQPDSLNPFISRTGVGWRISTITTETLLKPSREFFYYHGVKPWIIVKWWNNDNYTTWVLRLKKGLTWSNGEVVTAEDLKYTIRYLKERGVPPWTTLLKWLSSTRIINETSVMFNFTKPAPYLLRLLTSTPLLYEEEVRERALKDIKYFNVTLGLYKVVKWTEKELVLTANDRYPLGKPPFKTMRFIFVNDAHEAYRLFIEGDADVSINAISPFRMKDLINDRRFKITISPDLSTYVLVVNPRRELLRDIPFRHAMSMCFNVTELKVDVFNGYVDVTCTYVPLHLIPPRGVPDYLDFLKERGIRLGYNVTKCKAILSSLGYKDRDGDGMLETPTGEKLMLTMVAPVDDPLLVNVTKKVVDDLRRVGIGVNITWLKTREYVRQIYVTKDFDITLMEVPYYVFPSIELPALLIYSEEEGPYGLNIASVDHDMLSMNVLYTYNLTAKLERILDLEGVLFADRIYVPLFARPIIEVCRADKVGRYSSIYGLLTTDALTSLGAAQVGGNIPFTLIRLLINVALVIVGLLAMYSAKYVVESGYLLRP